MKLLQTLLVLVAISCLELASLLSFFNSSAHASNLTLTKDTLSSSAISYNARVKSPTAAGSSHVWIYTSGAVCGNTSCYSVSTAGLKPGDVLLIGGTNTYTVDSIVDADEFTLTTNLAAGDADDATDTIFLKRRPIHTVTFTTASAIANGFFQVLLPAASSNYNDGLADITGFDFGGGTVTVTGTDASGYTFSVPDTVATASGGVGCTAPANYHCFEFHYSGAGGNGTAITLTIGSGTNTPIAPAPTASHSVGTADTYSVIVKNFTSGANPNTDTATDQTTGRLAVIEPVRVTATVDPTITFTIAGIASGQNPCGTGVANQTDIDTTTAINAPVAVPFGTMALNTFKDAAHLLTVSTNAASGYVVTAQENDQLGKDGGTTPFIPDTTGDNGTATESVTDTWDTATGNAGFGYTLKSVSGATVPFTSTGATFNTRVFPSVADPDSPLVQTIMSSTGTADTHQANVCYRLAVDATQAAGDYENQITYTATASF